MISEKIDALVNEWVPGLLGFGNVDDYVLVSDDSNSEDERAIRFSIFTGDHEYSIRATDKKDSDGYLGCILHCLKKRPGEDWIRSADCHDGPFTKESWNGIVKDIARKELVELSDCVREQTPIVFSKCSNMNPIYVAESLESDESPLYSEHGYTNYQLRAWDTERKQMWRVIGMNYEEWSVTTCPLDVHEPRMTITERNSFNNHDTDRHILMRNTNMSTDIAGPMSGWIFEGDIIACRKKGASDDVHVGVVAWNPRKGSFVILGISSRNQGTALLSSVWDVHILTDIYTFLNENKGITYEESVLNRLIEKDMDLLGIILPDGNEAILDPLLMAELMENAEKAMNRDLERNAVGTCIECDVEITPENDSGWERFTDGGHVTQAVCKTCAELDDQDMPKDKTERGLKQIR